MGVLLHLRTQTRHPLPARATVGRSRSAHVRAPTPRMSREHALLIWRAGHWEIRDLGSRHGTTVDGHPLIGGEGFPLKSGAQICFGDELDPWVLESAVGPGVRSR